MSWLPELLQVWLQKNMQVGMWVVGKPQSQLGLMWREKGEVQAQDTVRVKGGHSLLLDLRAEIPQCAEWLRPCTVTPDSDLGLGQA